VRKCPRLALYTRLILLATASKAALPVEQTTRFDLIVNLNPLVFNPTDKCPAFVVNPKIAQWAREKQRTDEVEYAQLLEDNVPAAPIYSGLDGGMNEVFLARFPVRVTLAKAVCILPATTATDPLGRPRWFVDE
jgi:hypothetical protein